MVQATAAEEKSAREITALTIRVEVLGVDVHHLTRQVGDIAEVTLRDEMNTRFDKVEARLDSLESRFDKLESRFDKFEAGQAQIMSLLSRLLPS